MEKKNCSIIYNPVSSGFKEKKLDKVCKSLDEKYEVDKRKSEVPGHAVELTKKSNLDSDLIISYGGDGTFGEVIKGIYDEDQKALISHIPIGTANDLRRNFGLKKDPVKSAELIRDGEKQALDIFTINNIPFSYVAAFGYLANVPCNTPAKLKKYLKYAAYLVKALEEFKNKKPYEYDLTLTYDGNTFDEKAIVGTFTNSTGFGGMNLFNDVSLNDDKFEVTFVKNMNKSRMPKIALDIFSDPITHNFDLKKYPDVVTHFQTNDLTIKFNNREPEGFIDLDGDPMNVSTGDGVYRLKRGRSINMQLPKK